MSVSAIQISENKIATTSKMFSANYIAGTAAGWRKNSVRFETRAQEGFYRFSFALPMDRFGLVNLREYIEDGLGRHLEAYSIDGRLAWEGFIYRLELALPNAKIAISLDQVANRVFTHYSTATSQDVGLTIQDYDPEVVARLENYLDGSGSWIRGTTYNDTDSQALFGIKEHIITLGKTTAAIANRKPQGHLARYAFPRMKQSITKESGVAAAPPHLKIECRGYFETFKWMAYNRTGMPLTIAASTLVSNVVTAAGQYVKSTKIDTNASVIENVYDIDRQAYNILLGAAKVDDASFNRWVIGMYEDRQLLYEAAPAASPDNVEYYSSILRADSRIRSRKEGVIPAAMVRPNTWMKTEDIMPFGKTAPDGTDLSLSYIESVKFSEPDDLKFETDPVDMDNVRLAQLSTGAISRS